VLRERTVGGLACVSTHLIPDSELIERIEGVDCFSMESRRLRQALA
jgi:hypothetical protein